MGYAQPPQPQGPVDVPKARGARCRFLVKMAYCADGAAQGLPKKLCASRGEADQRGVSESFHGASGVFVAGRKSKSIFMGGTCVSHCHTTVWYLYSCFSG